jgi:hypothetical protein
MLDVTNLFHGLPLGLRDPLLKGYVEIARNYAEHRWEPSELNGGKLCEIVYSIVDGATSGAYATSPFKPPRLVDACRAIEQRPSNPALFGDRSLRVLIPRLLPYLYEIRNNRGVGHVGGDVDPNYSDATAVFSCSNWIMAELIRVFHSVPLEQAQSAVDSLVERKHPLVWEIEGIKRVLDPSMPRSDQVLTLLYSSPGWTAESDLRSWVEYKNSTNFRDVVLTPLHKNRMVEHHQAKQCLRITPRGAKDVEDRILSK